MKLVIEIDLDNSAFDNLISAEIKGILLDFNRQINATNTRKSLIKQLPMKLRDSNGNMVAYITIEGE